MEALDFWRLNDELSIVQAALLLVGRDPAEDAHVEKWEETQRPAGYEAAKWAIVRALANQRIEGQLREKTKTVRHDGGFVEEVEIPGSTDFAASVVEVESLRDWLRKRGFNEGFFFANKQPVIEFLDRAHPRFASKLAAAVTAWRAMEAGDYLKNRTPKQGLMKWLREHAAEFGLTDEEGNPNETGIAEIAKVANWAPGGGAPKTAVAERDGVDFSRGVDFDDEIPF